MQWKLSNDVMLLRILLFFHQQKVCDAVVREKWQRKYCEAEAAFTVERF